MLAAGVNKVSAVRVLVERGNANLEPTDARMGWTALFLAASRGHTEACVELLKRGANATARDASG